MLSPAIPNMISVISWHLVSQEHFSALQFKLTRYCILVLNYDVKYKKIAKYIFRV